MKKLLSILVVTLLLACSPVSTDVVLKASFGTVTLTQKQCKNEEVMLLSQLLGVSDPSKLKEGLAVDKEGNKLKLCYLDAKDSPTGHRFIIDESGGMGNFEPDAAVKKD